MQYVHIIPPQGSGGHRHEERFPDEMTEEEIAAVVKLRARFYGELKHDGKDVPYLDHPDTVVALGDAVEKKFVEKKRIAMGG